MSKKHKNEDLTFEQSLKQSNKKELRKICKHFQEMNISAVTENYQLADMVRGLQDELSQTKSSLNHKTRMLEALVNS